MVEHSVNYKEIIYLDQVELDSTLAQLERGVHQSLQKNQSSKEEQKTINSDGAAGELKVSAAVLQAQLTGNYHQDTEHGNADTIGESVNISLNDYNLDRLLNILQKSKDIQLVSDIDQSSDGDFVLIYSPFTLTDFDFISTLLSERYLKDLMKQTPSENGGTNWDKETEKSFKMMASYSNLGNLLFQDNNLIKMENLLCYAEKNNFRMNSGQLQQITGTNRNLFLLGIVESTVSEEKLDNLASTLGSGDLSLFGNMMSAFSESILSTASLIKKGDKLVKPIALYF